MKSPKYFRHLMLACCIFVWRSAAADLPDSARNVNDEEVRRIAGLLMAPCCWTMTADAHSSEIAYEMRAQIRAALAQGKSETEILQTYVAQYGERILAKPTKQGFNLLAWILPFVALTIGALILWRFLHHNAAPVQTPTPTMMAADPNDPYAQRMERELQALDR